MCVCVMEREREREREREIVYDIRITLRARRRLLPDSIQFFTDISRRCFLGSATSRQSVSLSVRRTRTFLSQGQKWRSIIVDIVKTVSEEKVERCDHQGESEMCERYTDK